MLRCKYAISIVFNFSWGDCKSQEKLKTMVMQNFGGTTFRACLHGRGEPQIGEVPCSGSPHLSCKHDQNKRRGYMDSQGTPPKRVTSPIWAPPPPCKQALSIMVFFEKGLQGPRRGRGWGARPPTY